MDLDSIDFKDWYPSRIKDKADSIIKMLYLWTILLIVTIVIYQLGFMNGLEFIISLFIVAYFVIFIGIIGIIFILDSLKGLR